MEHKSNFKYWIKNLNRKHRLSLTGEHDEGEVWYMHISPLNMLAGFLALVLVLFIIILTTVAYTPILDLIPGYPGNRSRELLVQNIMRLDSLERSMASMQVYADNVALIMEGKTPVVRSVGDSADTLRSAKSVRRNAADSLLRAQMENPGIYRLEAGSGAAKVSLQLVAPIQGIVSQHFNPREGRYGVSLAAAAGQQVMAVAPGTVIMAVWSPDMGHVVQIQHQGNIISSYTHCASVLPSVGARVKGGEAIGYTDEAGKGLFEFELWVDGAPVDPEKYMVF